jgi:ankyrin repeat protein
LGSKYGYEEICRILIDAGISVNLQDDAGFTALHSGMISSSISLARHSKLKFKTILYS